MIKFDAVFSEVEQFDNNIKAIQLVKTLDSFHEVNEDQALILSRYIGWGSLAKVFPDSSGKFASNAWENRHFELKSLLTQDEYESARSSILDAFYTPRPIVDAMWKIASHLNADHGVILEPSCGTGHFIGACPKPELSRFIAVEIDPITARISKLLHKSNAQVFETGFEKVELPERSIDLAIANPPYGDFSIYMKDLGEYNQFSVHNQFILKSLKSLKTGSYGIFVVSHYVMDSSNQKAREQMYLLANLVGAYRLPAGAFQSSGVNTEVVTDILVFKRKSTEAEEIAYDNMFDARFPDWVYVEPLNENDERSVYINRYFNLNRDHIAGTVELKTGRFGQEIHVESSANPLGDLNTWIDTLPGCENSPRPLQATQQSFDSLVAHIYVTLSGKEIGVIDTNEAGELFRIIEQDVDNGFRFKSQVLSPETVWSERYIAHISGQYYENIPTFNEMGQKVYQVNDDGYSNGRVVYERKFIDIADIGIRSKLGKTRFEKLKLLVILRDCLTAQLSLESNNAHIDDIEANRLELNAKYDRFFKKYGYINSSANMALIGDLPDAGLLLSLEMDYKKEMREYLGVDEAGKKMHRIIKPESAVKSAIFNQRVIFKNERPTRAESPDHALSLSLSYYGAINLGYIAGLLSVSEQDVLDEMHFNTADPVIFFDPELGQWLHKSVYLSGNVRHKLKVAQDANDNIAIKALEQVIPERIALENISISLGMAWVPHQYYAQFVRALTDDMNAQVTYEPVSNIYEVTCKPSEAKSTMFGTPDMDLESMLNHVLNSKTIRIMRKVVVGWGRETMVFDQDATELAVSIAENIKYEFNSWLYTQGEILEDLDNIYNERFNSLVAPNFENYNVIIEGKVPDNIICLNPHQVNAVYRGVLSDFTLYAHEVGAGKSFVAIARAMLRKQLGLSHKSIIVVPNHLVLQFASDIYRLFPSASVLAATPKDFNKKNRKRLFCRIATGNYDLVVMAHSSFEFIRLSGSIQKTFIEEEIREIEDAILYSEDKGSRSAKALEGMRKRAVSRLEDALNDDRVDRLITFDMLGVDNIEVDEFHYYKNLQFHTNMTNIVGMGNPSGSYRAFDMYLKFKYLHMSGGSAGCYTGTPVSNSAVELFNLMRFMIPQELDAQGLGHFDNWARMYAENSTKFEASDTGKLKQVTRFAREWRNLSSMMGLWFQFADTISNEDLERIYLEKHGKRFPIPKLKGGQRQTHVIEPTYEQQAILDEVIERYNKLDQISDSKERNAERLRLMDIARKLSTAARCVNPVRYAKESGGKLEVLARNVFEVFQEWDELKGTQVIFLDRSIPRSASDNKVIKQYDELCQKLELYLRLNDETNVKRIEDRLEQFNASEIEEMRNSQNYNWSAYQEIKDLLVSYGMEPQQVRFIQEAKTDQEKQDMFDLVNEGEIRVLIGSTARMGCGTNIQRRLVHLHHADVGFLPSVITQREGRILRQGNMFYEMLGADEFEVGISCYVTEHSCDGRMWELNSIKLKMINILNNYNGEHAIDFGADADAISMKEIAALATGNPLMLERVELESEIQRIERLKANHLRKQAGIILEVSRAETRLKEAPHRLAGYQEANNIYSPIYEAQMEVYRSFKMNINGEIFTSSNKAVDYINNNKIEGGVYKVNGADLRITKAREAVRSYFKNRTSPFHFTSKQGEDITNSLDAGGCIFSDVVKGEPINLGLLFGLPLALVANGYLTVSTPDEKFVIVRERLERLLTSTSIASTLLNLVKKFNDEFNDIEYLTERTIARSRDTINQLKPLIGIVFDKDATLAYQKMRLNLVQQALATEDPQTKLNELIEENRAEVDALTLRMSEESGRSIGAVVNESPKQDAEIVAEVVAQALQVVSEIAPAKPKRNKRAIKVVVDGRVVTATQLDLFG